MIRYRRGMSVGPYYCACGARFWMTNHLDAPQFYDHDHPTEWVDKHGETQHDAVLVTVCPNCGRAVNCERVRDTPPTVSQEARSKIEELESEIARLTVELGAQREAQP